MVVYLKGFSRWNYKHVVRITYYRPLSHGMPIKTQTKWFGAYFQFNSGLTKFSSYFHNDLSSKVVLSRSLVATLSNFLQIICVQTAVCRHLVTRMNTFARSFLSVTASLLFAWSLLFIRFSREFKVIVPHYIDLLFI